jgi:uncharacterized protein with von Willebrand factor type A (vWA) domain
VELAKSAGELFKIMLESLPHTFRKHNLSADVRTLLLLRKAMDKKLVHTLGDMYLVLRGLIANSPKDYGPFATAFYEYFLAIDIQKGETLNSAILRSETFKEWREGYEETMDFDENEDITQLIDQFLDEVHTTTFDIQKMVSGEEILNNDDPDRIDSAEKDDEDATRTDKMGDYSDISLEELRKRMERVAAQQKRKHRGGNHWIGQGGYSPYGNSGAAKGGIRVGGAGGGKMARAVIGDPNFYPADTKALLSDDNIDAALATLKGIEDETSEMVLDIPNTISEGVKMGGLFLPIEQEKTQQKIQVILLIDNGGYSMSPYIRTVQKLFSKMKTRFTHDLKVYYFHNTIYGGVYEDASRRNLLSIDKLLQNKDDYSVFVIGDADMAPYELHNSSMASWHEIAKRFPRSAWLNPLPLRFWASSDTVPILRSVFEMYPLTPEGIEKSVLFMNTKRKYFKG